MATTSHVWIADPDAVWVQGQVFSAGAAEGTVVRHRPVWKSSLNLNQFALYAHCHWTPLTRRGCVLAGGAHERRVLPPLPYLALRICI